MQSFLKGSHQNLNMVKLFPASLNEKHSRSCYSAKTTTQPNLNGGLGLTRFSLFNPPTHRNPNSTRKNDHGGLKCGM